MMESISGTQVNSSLIKFSIKCLRDIFEVDFVFIFIVVVFLRGGGVDWEQELGLISNNYSLCLVLIVIIFLSDYQFQL